jgi:hypothetical protein
MTNSNEGDFGQADRDAAERATAEINLEQPSSTDDVPWSPPDREPRGAEMAEVERETLSMRIMQEEPDPTAVVEDETGPLLGGDDPLAIPAEQDVLGGDVDTEDRVILDDERGPEAGAMHLEQ